MPTPISAPATSEHLDTPAFRLRLDICLYILILQCAVMTMPVLKLMGIGPVINWSWLWVLAPFWAPGALLAVIVGIEQTIDSFHANHGAELQLVASQLGLPQANAAVVGQ